MPDGMSTFNMAETLYDYPEGSNIQDKTAAIEDEAIVPCFDSLGVVSKTTIGAIRSGVNAPAPIQIVADISEITTPVNGQMVAISGDYGSLSVYLRANNSWFLLHSIGGE